MKKYLALIIAMVIMFNGCAGGEKSSKVGDSTDKHITAEQNGNNSPAKETKQNDVAQNDSDKYGPPEMKGEITISTMYKQEYLQDAAKKFMEKYPNVKIEINEYAGTTGEKMEDNYRTSLNTKIMSGKAEDIIFATEIPVKKYMDMGLFEDLSSFVSQTKEFNNKKYFMNILESARDEKNQLYLIPTMASFSTINFSTDVVTDAESAEKPISRFSEAVKYAKTYVEKSKLKNTFLYQNEGQHYMNDIVHEYRSTLIDLKNRKANINNEQYISWLNDLRDMNKKGYFQTDSSFDFYHTEYHFAMSEDFDTQAAFYNLDPANKNSIGTPVSDENGNVFALSNSYVGINSASKNKKLGWEFIKYLLSDEVQTLPSIYRLAINKNGFNECVKRNFKLYSDGTNSTVKLEDYKALLEKWMLQINKCDTLDPVIIKYFMEENGKFWERTQSAEKTAQILQDKITQYLNE